MENIHHQDQFAKVYLECAGVEVDNYEITKTYNRIRDIIAGKKGVQLYDLPVFIELLDASCEEILSADEVFVPNSKKVTNYLVSFSKDKNIWQHYINHEEKLMANADEYGKTVLDYALEFKNYEFLKYLVDNNWFVDNEDMSFHCTRHFGAGTKIKPKSAYQKNDLQEELCENIQLRVKIILLAIENNDIEMLEKLHARELSSLYCIQSPRSGRELEDYQNEYNEDMLINI